MNKRTKCRNCGKDVVFPETGLKLPLIVCVNSSCKNCGLLSIYTKGAKDIKKKWICSVCGKAYETYPVILDENLLSITLELELRDKYYKGNKGLCKECRKENE